MWGGDGSSGGGGGGVSSSQLAGMLIGYATETWVDEHYISIDFFSRLFQAHGTENGSEIDVMPNDMDTTITSVESMFGFWTNLYISALGSNGAAPAGISLGMLTDVNISGTPSAGQVLTFDAVSGKWVNGNAQAGATALANLTDVTLTSLQTNQILIYDATTQKWVNSSVKTVNGYSLFGTGDIAVGGGAGNYLPLTGGTMTGGIRFTGYSYAYSTDYSGIEYYANNLFINVRNNRLSIGKMGINQATLDLTNIVSGVQQYFFPNASGTLALTSDLTGYLPLSGGTLTGWIEVVTTGRQGWVSSFGTSSVGVLVGIRNIAAIGTLNTQNLVLMPDGGNVGIYTASPTYKLTVNGETLISSDIHIGNTGIGFNRNVTNGTIFNTSKNACQINFSTIYNGMEFGTATSAGSYTVAMVLQVGGNLGIGVSSPSYKLHVAGTIYATGAITALSDARKKDITGEAGVAVEQIAHAPAVQFLWKDKERRKDGQQVGTLAQYWQTVLPEVVMDKGGELSMQYGVAALVSAIVTARKVVDHERRIHELEKENERLRMEVEQLRLN